MLYTSIGFAGVAMRRCYCYCKLLVHKRKQKKTWAMPAVAALLGFFFRCGWWRWTFSSLARKIFYFLSLKKLASKLTGAQKFFFAVRLRTFLHFLRCFCLLASTVVNAHLINSLIQCLNSFCWDKVLLDKCITANITIIEAFITAQLGATSWWWLETACAPWRWLEQKSTNFLRISVYASGVYHKK